MSLPRGRRAPQRRPDLRPGCSGARPVAVVPDSQVGWLPFALSARIRAVRTGPNDAVHSESPPVTAPVVAVIVARVGRAPWVAAFHDGKLGNPIIEALGGPRPGVHTRRDPGRLADTLGAATDNARRVRATRSASPPSARDDK